MPVPQSRQSLISRLAILESSMSVSKPAYELPSDCLLRDVSPRSVLTSDCLIRLTSPEPVLLIDSRIRFTSPESVLSSDYLPKPTSPNPYLRYRRVLHRGIRTLYTYQGGFLYPAALPPINNPPMQPQTQSAVQPRTYY